MANGRLLLLNTLLFFLFAVVDLILSLGIFGGGKKNLYRAAFCGLLSRRREGRIVPTATCRSSQWLHSLAALGFACRVTAEPPLTAPDSIVRACVCESHKTLRGDGLRWVTPPQPQDRLAEGNEAERGKSYFSFIYHLPRGRRQGLSQGPQ